MRGRILSFSAFGKPSTRRLGDLQPIHQPGLNRIIAEKLRRMSDRQLLDTVFNPADGQYVKVRPGQNATIDGNSRLYEMVRRMQQDRQGPFKPDLEIPVQEVPKGVLDSSLPDDF